MKKGVYVAVLSIIFSLLFITRFASTLNWPTFMNNDNRTGYQNTTINVSKLDSIWNFTTGSSISSPFIVDDIAYAASGKYIYAINATNGSLIWNYTDFAGIDYVFAADFSPLSVSGGVLYIGVFGPELYPDPANTFHAINATTGEQIWNISEALGSDLSAASAPIVSNGIVYFSGYGINAVYASNGSDAWNVSAITYSIFSGNSPALYNNIIYINNIASVSPSTGRIHAINATNGSEIWNYTISGFSTAASSLALDDGIIYAQNSLLRAINATTGSEIWNSTTAGSNSVTVYNDIIYEVDTQTLYAFNTTDGSEIWNYTNETLSFSGFGYPALSNDRFFIGGDNGYLYSLSLEDGSDIKIMNIGGTISDAPIITEDSLYIATYDNPNGIIRAYTMCEESWTCGDWGTCSERTQTRTCTDANACTHAPLEQPALNQSCTEESAGSVDTGGGGSSSSGPATQKSSLIGLLPNTPTAIKISNPEIDIRSVIIYPKTGIPSASLNITKSNEDIRIPLGTVYQALNIKAESIKNENLNNVTFEFRINKTWMRNNNASAQDILLLRRLDNESAWNQLATDYLRNDSNYYYFSSISPGFSTFTILAKDSACEIGAKKCGEDNGTLICSANSEWVFAETCSGACFNGECTKTNVVPSIKNSIFVYILGGVASIGMILGIFFIIRILIRKKQTPIIIKPMEKEPVKIEKQVKKKSQKSNPKK